MKKRIKDKKFLEKIVSAKKAAKVLKGDITVATSGFTPSGYPKSVPKALSDLVKQNKQEVNMTLITGASVGDELDGEFARQNIVKRRFPYQTHSDLRKKINNGEVNYQDLHLSHVAQMMSYGYLGNIDFAIVEAIGITEDGKIIPSTSVGIAPQAVELADKVIIEINTSQPKELEGVHDIYTLKNPPNRKPIPIEKPGDRIGSPYIEVDFDKVIGIVESDIKDDVRPLGSIDEDSKKISRYIIEFLKNEVKENRLPKDLLPLQSGVGSVANAVLAGLVESDFENLTCYTEVIQDSMLDLIDAGKVKKISGTSFTPSKKGLNRLLENMDHYAKYCILRPMEISNNPEVIRRLGVIALNTAVEVDIYGHVNSTNILGSRMMNGLGGSGDFTRNAKLSVFTTMSTGLDGKISSIVPMVSHVDHTEHDVDVIVTERGIADLRGLSPSEKAQKIIDNCAHPKYKEKLQNYLDEAKKLKYKHEPHNLEKSLSFQQNFIKNGKM